MRNDCNDQGDRQFSKREGSLPYTADGLSSRMTFFTEVTGVTPG
jgi:hypothetical protein